MGGQGSGTNPNSKRNLKLPKWRAESGTPTGVKKYNSITQALRKIGFEIDPFDPSGASWYEAAARVMWWNACHGSNGGGSPRAVEAIASRLDGRPAESVTVTTIAQRSPEEHAQEIVQILERLNQHDQSSGIN